MKIFATVAKQFRDLQYKNVSNCVKIIRSVFRVNTRDSCGRLQQRHLKTINICISKLLNPTILTIH